MKRGLRSPRGDFSQPRRRPHTTADARRRPRRPRLSPAVRAAYEEPAVTAAAPAKPVPPPHRRCGSRWRPNSAARSPPPPLRPWMPRSHGFCVMMTAPAAHSLPGLAKSDHSANVASKTSRMDTRTEGAAFSGGAPVRVPPPPPLPLSLLLSPWLLAIPPAAPAAPPILADARNCHG